MNQIINGDCFAVLPTLPKARMIFADPPDNLGLKYNGFTDKWPHSLEYRNWLLRCMLMSLAVRPDVCWWSLWPANALLVWPPIPIGGKVNEPGPFGIECKQFIWRYTFGQHNSYDCGNGYRTLLRFSKPGVKWNTDAIRVPSIRQSHYKDKRAYPKGRVPDNVWEFPRVCGTFKEKRKWAVTQHPESLIERMVLMSTKPGDLVIDLFAHSGTVNRVCKRLGRDVIGIDISPFYCERIADETGAELKTVYLVET